jgi:hypothetical protein
MTTHPLRHLALAAVVSTAAISQASAGCNSCGVPHVGPGRYIPVVEVPSLAGPIYVVNHGPVYTGPGIVTYPYPGWPMVVYPYGVTDYSVGRYHWQHGSPHWQHGSPQFDTRVRVYR